MSDRRANGSRERAPDDKLREAIQLSFCRAMDCFVASLLAMTAGAMDSHADHSLHFRMDRTGTATDIPRSRRYINPARQHVRAFGVCIGIARMTGTTRSSGGLDDRRKRLLFRCWHRGTREMDLILGRFADAEIAGLNDEELSQLEHLIEVPDPDLYAAVSGNAALPAEYATDLLVRIKSFRPDQA
jgi:antitoxin CptB